MTEQERQSIHEQAGALISSGDLVLGERARIQALRACVRERLEEERARQGGELSAVAELFAAIACIAGNADVATGSCILEAMARYEAAVGLPELRSSESDG